MLADMHQQNQHVMAAMVIMDRCAAMVSAQDGRLLTANQPKSQQPAESLVASWVTE